MSGLTIFRSNLSSPALLLSSAGTRGAANVLVKTDAEGVFAVGSAGTAVFTSNRGSAARLLRNSGRRTLWIGGQATAAGTAPAAAPQRPGESTAAPAIVAAAPSDAEAAAPAVEPAPAPPAEAETGEPASPPAAEARSATKLELAIDSLPGYELVKPIPVIVESLGNKVFVAEVPDLDISITGTSVSNALLQLKDQIVRTYEGHRSKRNPDPERVRQLGKLESYIVKRRNWF